MEDNQIDVGENIRRQRETAKLTLVELAQKVTEAGHSMSFGRLGKLERGALRIDVNTLFVLASCLEVPPARLLQPPVETAKIVDTIKKLMVELNEETEGARRKWIEVEEARAALEIAQDNLGAAKSSHEVVIRRLNERLRDIELVLLSSPIPRARLLEQFTGWYRIAFKALLEDALSIKELVPIASLVEIDPAAL